MYFNRRFVITPYYAPTKQNTQRITRYNTHHPIVLLMILPSEPGRLIAATPRAILCGEIILPAVAPAPFAATNQISLIPNCCATDCCNVANITLADVAEPVTKHPIPPISGAIAI